MKLEWCRDLETGNPYIDWQHRDLFQRIGDLINACQERREQQEVVAMLAFLREYVQSHFSAEEQYQAASRYPYRREHAGQHDLLLRRLALLEEEYARDGVSLPVVTNSLKLTYEWLSGHILLWDKQMALIGKDRTPRPSSDPQPAERWAEGLSAAF